MINREVSWYFALKLLCQQLTSAIAFSLLLAWVSWFLTIGS
ncbi:hypothetical protein Ple7327_3851 [Pleurocapsa sp. PCC 7327]|nr:hypothetical protein [Pleurocapsa sp. PCC 7327]AFY79010.1 hypothetical protein Ple7327_3851 [Pleurocapsa sp. PCC 7327]